MNNNNLKPQCLRTKSEQREIARKGGKASGKARNLAKNLRERLLLMSEQKMIGEYGDTITQEDQIANEIIRRAITGDLKAIRLYAELTGQLSQKMEISAAPPIAIYPYEKRIS